MSTMLVMEGAEYDKASDGIWLSDKFAAANDISVGDTLTTTYTGIEISGEVVGLVKSGEQMICVADENQLMPDHESFGFMYIAPEKLEEAYTELMSLLLKKESSRNPHSVLVMYSYLYHKEHEVNRLTTAVECVRYGIAPEEAMEHIRRS